MNPYTWMRNNIKTGAGIVAPLYESASQDNHMALIRRKTVVNPSFRLENIVAAILPEDVLDEEITEQIDGKMVTQPLTKYLYYRKGVVPIIMPGRRAAISLEGMLEEAGVQGVFSIAIPMVINRIEDVHSELETAIKRLKITDATGITPTLYINVRVANSDSKEATERLLSDKLEIAMDALRTPEGDKQIGVLSGGERRRVEIARALAVDPQFILLDEPFAGVDPIAVEDIQSIVAQLKNKNIGILITDHDVQATLAITDRTYLMFNGGILKEGTPEELIQNQLVGNPLNFGMSSAR